jgi:putative lipoic acid-binding regulatory protein
VVSKHAPGIGDEHVSVKVSGKGNYVSITIVIEATGVEQLTLMFEELKTNASVKLVL